MEHLCCEHCFTDFFVKETIIKTGSIGTCSFCGSRDSRCVSPKELQKLFLPLIDLYSPAEDFLKDEDKKSFRGHYIWQKIQADWNIFNFKEEASVKTLLSEICFDETRSPSYQKLTESYVENLQTFKKENGIESKRLEARWLAFSDELKKQNRFFPKTAIDRFEYIALLQFLEMKIPKDEKLYRARNSYGKEKFSSQEMNKPSFDMTKNGRANPVGIPYLYLASDANVAIYEIKPSLKDPVTVGEFIVQNDLRIIDLRDVSPFQFIKSEDFDTLVRDIDFLYKLGEDLAKTINPKDADLEYLPTQYLCELIKSAGWDGVAYKSSFAQGYNLAVFFDEKLSCIGTKLYEIQEAKLTYKEI